jgi:enoyl-CoA hydratase
MNASFSVELTDHVAHVSLRKKTMDPSFFDDCHALTEALSTMEGVRVVLLKSEEKAFSYGLDLAAAFKEFGHLFIGGGLAGPRTELLGLIRRWQAAFSGFAELPMPVIAAVHGWCVGGGLDLICACDIRVATRDARFSLREAKIGIVADIGSLQRLPPIIGSGLTRELAFTAGDFDGERALEMRLVNRLFDSKEAMWAGAQELALEIAANPPLAVQGVKDVLRHLEEPRVREGLRYVAAWNSAFLASEDLAEAMSAHMAKRTPVFKGK